MASIRAVAIAMFMLALGELSAAAAAQDKVKVVATFTILADIVRNVGGDRVEVVSLVGPNGDAHVYAPTPGDARTIGSAQLVVVNGLGFEGWIARLAAANKGKVPMVVASNGVKPRSHGAAHGPGHRQSKGHADPHAWQSVGNVKTYAANIRDALIAVDPAGKAVYEAATVRYVDQLAVLDREIRDTLARIPQDRRRVITSHDFFGYFAQAYGVTFIAVRGLSTESQPSARDMARIIAQVKAQQVAAVFLENITDQRLMQRIAEETGARIGGRLISDALTGPGDVAPTYADLMRHNARQLAAALGN
jgi:zinc/manganese transport system substrate-binding protein